MVNLLGRSLVNAAIADEESVQGSTISLVDSTDVVPVEGVFAADDDHLFVDVLAVRLAVLPVGEVERFAAGRPDPFLLRFVECSSRPEVGQLSPLFRTLQRH